MSSANVFNKQPPLRQQYWLMSFVAVSPPLQRQHWLMSFVAVSPPPPRQQHWLMSFVAVSPSPSIRLMSVGPSDINQS
jgi:hypothetical protein